MKKEKEEEDIDSMCMCDGELRGDNKNLHFMLWFCHFMHLAN